jgi:hypothetical protein
MTFAPRNDILLLSVVFFILLLLGLEILFHRLGLPRWYIYAGVYGCCGLLVVYKLFSNRKK